MHAVAWIWYEFDIDDMVTRSPVDLALKRHTRPPLTEAEDAQPTWKHFTGGAAAFAFLLTFEDPATTAS